MEIGTGTTEEKPIHIKIHGLRSGFISDGMFLLLAYFKLEGKLDVSWWVIVGAYIGMFFLALIMYMIFEGVKPTRKGKAE